MRFTDIYLKRYVISKEYEEEILKDLYILGISKATLFSELDGLADELNIDYCNLKQNQNEQTVLFAFFLFPNQQFMSKKQLSISILRSLAGLSHF